MNSIIISATLFQCPTCQFPLTRIAHVLKNVLEITAVEEAHSESNALLVTELVTLGPSLGNSLEVVRNKGDFVAVADQRFLGIGRFTAATAKEEKAQDTDPPAAHSCQHKMKFGNENADAELG